MARGVRELAPLDALTIVHAEDDQALRRSPDARGRDYSRFVASRPPEVETIAIDHVLGAAAEAGARMHILHLSAAEAVATIAASRERGDRVTVETCPHYLALNAEAIPAGATQFKCCPPIRDAANRDALWRALADGLIDCVVSDHSPCTPELKRPELGDFGLAWGGIASLEVSLPVVWTQARRRGHGLVDLVGWMAVGPAKLAGLPGKGALAAGYDADLVRLAPEETFTVVPEALHHRNPVTPYAGQELCGVVKTTWLRGEEIDLDGPARGRLLRRDSHRPGPAPERLTTAPDPVS
jgi:allantoinase